jgi:hypothetical protein
MRDGGESMPELTVKEGQAWAARGRRQRQPKSVEESRRIVLGLVSEEDWQARVIEVALLHGWAVYHALPAQLGVPRNLEGELEKILKALLSGNVGRTLQVVRELLDALAKMRWRTPVTSPGFPDLVLLKGPVIEVMEIKSEIGKLSPEQEEWLARWREAIGGDHVRVCRPSDEAEILAMLAA